MRRRPGRSGDALTTACGWRCSSSSSSSSPAERAAFVLHDVFGFSFEAVGSIVGRSPAACRQLASRARRRIESETSPARFDVDKGELSVVEQFIQASAEGDMDALVQVLDRRRRGGPTRRRRPGAPREAVVGRDRVVGLLLWFLRNWT